MADLVGRPQQALQELQAMEVGMKGEGPNRVVVVVVVRQAARRLVPQEMAQYFQLERLEQQGR